MQRIRESLTLLLIGLLPFHAFLVTTGTKLIAGPGNAPLTMLALWKEALLGIILLIAFVEWCKKPSLRTDLLDRLIIALILLSVVVTAMTHGDLRLYLFGFKYDFIPLIAFVVLRRLCWSQAYMSRVFTVLLCSAGVVAVYAVLSLYLPPSWFTWLGYSDLHSLYTPDGPLAAYQQIEGVPIRRAQSTFSGPNQMGLWLLLPFSIALLQVQPIVGFFALIAMVLSMSRAAVLAAAVVTCVVVWQRASRRMLLPLVGALVVVGVSIGVVVMQLAPHLVSRAMSSSGHITRPLEAVHTIASHPFGLGLGTAGPASNRVSDTCVYVPGGADASWAADRPSLCVFVGDAQVQPELPCTCPLLPENWYLQIGVETGVIGMVLFLVLIICVLRKSVRYPEVFLPFLAISLTALVLHSWEDTSVAYSLWLLLAAVLPVPFRTE